MTLFCERCRRRVPAWVSTQVHQGGTTVTELHWTCRCGADGSRTMITIEVRDTVL